MSKSERTVAHARPPADVRLLNARVITASAVQPAAEALALHGRRVVFAGRPPADLDCVAPDSIGAVKPLLTVCDGRIVYEV